MGSWIPVTNNYATLASEVLACPQTPVLASCKTLIGRDFGSWQLQVGSTEPGTAVGNSEMIICSSVGSVGCVVV